VAGLESRRREGSFQFPVPTAKFGWQFTVELNLALETGHWRTEQRRNERKEWLDTTVRFAVFAVAKE
jgi:hypothetical protein